MDLSGPRKSNLSWTLYLKYSYKLKFSSRPKLELCVLRQVTDWDGNGFCQCLLNNLMGTY